MFAPRRFLFLVLLALAIGLGSVAPADTARMAATGAPILSIPEPVEDPFPIARIRVTGDQLVEALKLRDLGTLVRLPRQEFEARVRKAGLAEERDPPRLVEAKYRAAYAGGDLGGDAQWTIHNPRVGAAYLPLDPLKLAVAASTWADGSEAILGSFGPGFVGPASSPSCRPMPPSSAHE